MSHVYFIQRGGDGPIKIGISADITERLRALQTGCAEPLRLLGAIPGSEEEEREIHASLSAHRMSGEWFAPHTDVLAWVDYCSSFPPINPVKTEQVIPSTRAGRADVNDFHKRKFSEFLLRENAHLPAGRKRIAGLANVTEKAVQAWVSGKSLPNSTAMSNLFRGNPAAFHWFMLLVSARRFADLGNCTDDEAFARLSKKPTYIQHLYLAPNDAAFESVIVEAFQSELWEQWAFENYGAQVIDARMNQAIAASQRMHMGGDAE